MGRWSWTRSREKSDVPVGAGTATKGSLRNDGNRFLPFNPV